MLATFVAWPLQKISKAFLAHYSSQPHCKRSEDPTLVGWAEGPVSEGPLGQMLGYGQAQAKSFCEEAGIRFIDVERSEVHGSALMVVTFLVEGDVTPPGRLQQLLRGHCPGLAGQSEHRSLGTPEHRFELAILCHFLKASPRPGREKSLKLGFQGVSGAASSAFSHLEPGIVPRLRGEPLPAHCRMVEAVKWGQKHISGLNPQAGSLERVSSSPV